MKRFLKPFMLATLMLCMFGNTALAAEITPSKTSITMAKGATSISFDVILHVDNAFAGAEFGLKPSDTDVTLESLTFSTDTKDQPTVQTQKDGVLYFGFFADTNKYKSGTYNVATVTYTYTGSAERSIHLISSKIVTVEEDSKKTFGDTLSSPFTVTIKREPTWKNPDDVHGGSAGGGGGSAGGGGGVGGSSGSVSATSQTPDKAVVPTTIQPTFKDIEGHWGYDYIVKAVELGLFNGVSETEFAPEGLVSRGMAITAFGRLANASAINTANAFEDVSTDAYYAGYVTWGTQAGIIKGISETVYGPDNNITREQMSAIIARYIEANHVKTPNATNGIEKHGDFHAISTWAVDSMKLCYDMQLITGKANGQLDPQGNLTRAEYATIMVRFAGYMENQI